CPAERPDTGGEGLRILGRPAGRDPGYDDVPRDGIRLADDQGLPDLVHLEQDALDLGGKDLLAPDVDDVALPAQDLQVLTVDLDDVLGVEPTLLVEWRRGIEVAEHRGLAPDPQNVVEDLVVDHAPVQPDPQFVGRPRLRRKDAELGEAVRL